MSDNKPISNKHENIKRLKEFIKAGNFANLIHDIRATNMEIVGIKEKVNKLAKEQEEKFRLEDLAYEEALAKKIAAKKEIAEKEALARAEAEDKVASERLAAEEKGSEQKVSKAGETKVDIVDNKPSFIRGSIKKKPKESTVEVSADEMIAVEPKDCVDANSSAIENTDTKTVEVVDKKAEDVVIVDVFSKQNDEKVDVTDNKSNVDIDNKSKDDKNSSTDMNSSIDTSVDTSIDAKSSPSTDINSITDIKVNEAEVTTEVVTSSSGKVEITTSSDGTTSFVGKSKTAQAKNATAGGNASSTGKAVVSSSSVAPETSAASAGSNPSGSLVKKIPSFISPNQRKAPVYTPPVRKPLDMTKTPGGASYAPRPGNNGYGGGQRPYGGNVGGTPRPGGQNIQRQGLSRVPAPDINLAKVSKSSSSGGPKKDYSKAGDDKKSMNKRTLIRKGYEYEEDADERMGSRRKKTGKRSNVITSERLTHAIITTNNLTVKMLSEQTGIPAVQIIKRLMELGQMVTINSVVDFENMSLVAMDLGVELELKVDKTSEEKVIAQHDEIDDSKMENRPPIVTVMGHVDHGKTSLLDALRKTSVVSSEAGGITQHIGAYSVMINSRKITFIDTPGHEAFTAMRARGAQVTDVAVIVVAADDGIMPQTIEAINHAKAANVPIVVACNKIDKPTADIDRIKTQLTEHGIVPEEWGGDSPVVPVSAKAGLNLDKLLESILIVSDLKELKANKDVSAKGVIIEARLDKGKGPVASIIVQNGTLRVGDTVVSGMTYGHIRAMTDDKGRSVKEAGPSTAVSVLGFQDVPEAGNIMYCVENEKIAKSVISERNTKFRNEQQVQSNKFSLDDAFTKISEGELKVLNLIVKADVQGSVEALKDSLLKLSNDEVRVACIHCGVGAINKSDVMLAETSGAILIGFNVRADADTKNIADRTGVEIRTYRIIYECLDDVQDAIYGMLKPKFTETVLGRAEVRSIFKITGSGMVAGCYITSGKVVRNAQLRILRDNVVVAEGNVDSLKRFKDDVKEVATGYECGISIENVSDYKVGDIIEAFILEKVEIKK